MTATTGTHEIDWYDKVAWRIGGLQGVVAKIQSFMDEQNALSPSEEERFDIDFVIRLRLKEFERVMNCLLGGVVEEIDGTKSEGIGNAILVEQLAHPTSERPAVLSEHTQRALDFVRQHSGQHYQSLFGDRAHETRAALINLTPAISYLCEDIERYNDALKAEPEAEVDEAMVMGC